MTIPYAMRKVRNQDAYTVFNKETGHVYAKAASREAALAQLAQLALVPDKLTPAEPAPDKPAGRTRRAPLSDYAMRKVRGQDCYKVYSRRTKRVFAKCTTQEKAARQLKLLRAIRYNPAFEPPPAPRGTAPEPA